MALLRRHGRDALLQGLSRQLNERQDQGSQGQRAEAGAQAKFGCAQRAALQRVSSLWRCKVPVQATTCEDSIELQPAGDRFQDW